MTDLSEETGQRDEIVRLLNGQERWCEAGGCDAKMVGWKDGRAQYTCERCLALYSVHLTGLGPAWYRVGSIAPSTKVAQ